MNPAILNIPFIQVALPIVITLVGGIWLNAKSTDTMNKRLDDMNHRLDRMSGDIDSRFDRSNSYMDIRFNELLKRLDNIDSYMRDSERITRLEERTSPLARRGA